jgi:hypothetical protein
VSYDPQVQINEACLMTQSEKAGKFKIRGQIYWIPWSHIDEGSQPQKNGDSGFLIISEWIAREKGIPWDKKV